MTNERIIWARYGVREHGQWIDVKEFLSLIAPHRIGPDVFPEVSGTEGKERALWLMTEAEDGQRHETTIKDGEVFPPSSWPDNWEEVLYATRRPRSIGDILVHVGADVGDGADNYPAKELSMLTIHKAHYGIGSLDDINVRERLQSLVQNNSLDIIINNSTLTPNQNPFRGKRKQLNVIYSIDGGDQVTLKREEKDWLIIGPAQSREIEVPLPSATQEGDLIVGTVKPLDEQWDEAKWQEVKRAKDDTVGPLVTSLSQLPPMTAPALNDYLIRKFSISPQRLRGPMPIEIRDFHRNDLAQLFAELGFKRGAEIGVAEGNYSEVLLKANPEIELSLVDPWHTYSENPQGKSKEKHEFALNETRRKVAGYKVLFWQETSMEALRQIPDVPFDFVYIDGNHLFDFVIQDLIEWSKRVRSGGIVSGDDYYALDQKRWVGGGVVEAVQAYTNAHRIPIWYIFQGHKSVDFLWVKP